jgi:hypothetical protein
MPPSIYLYNRETVGYALDDTGTGYNFSQLYNPGGFSPPATSALAVARDNPDVVYVFDYYGVTFGLSTDAGITWTQRTGFPWGSYSRGVIVMVCHTAGDIHIAHHDNVVGLSGIWRSTNAGNTWTHLISTPYGDSGGLALGTNRLWYCQSNGTTFDIKSCNWDGSAMTLVATDTFAQLHAIDDSFVLSFAPNYSAAGWSADVTQTYPPITTTSQDCTLNYLPGPLVSGMTGSVVGHTSAVAANPQGAPGMDVTSTASYLGSGSGGLVAIDFFDTSKRFVAEQNIIVGTSPINGFLVFPSNAAYWGMYFMNAASSVSYQTHIQLSVHPPAPNTLHKITAGGVVTHISPPFPASARPWDVTIFDANTYVAAGEAATTTDVLVYRTTNAGTSWTLVQTIPFNQGFVDQDYIEFILLDAVPGSSVGYMYGYSYDYGASGVRQYLWKTADGGVTWTSFRNMAAVVDSSGYFVDRGHGGVVARRPPGILTAIPSRLATIVG